MSEAITEPCPEHNELVEQLRKLRTRSVELRGRL